jgi:hypothetical protein
MSLKVMCGCGCVCVCVCVCGCVCVCVGGGEGKLEDMYYYIRKFHVNGSKSLLRS